MQRVTYLSDDKLFLLSVPFTWLAICVEFARRKGIFSRPYFTIGPSATLQFADTPIDTWDKWGVLVGFLLITKILETGTVGIVGPWITTQIQDENRADLPYARWKCNLIVLLFTLYMGIDKIIDILCVLAQVDIALIELAGELLVIQLWTLPQWTRGKSPPPRRSSAAVAAAAAVELEYMPLQTAVATDDYRNGFDAAAAASLLRRETANGPLTPAASAVDIN